MQNIKKYVDYIFEKQIVDTFSAYINNRASSMEEQISKFTE